MALRRMPGFSQNRILILDAILDSSARIVRDLLSAEFHQKPYYSRWYNISICGMPVSSYSSPTAVNPNVR